MRAAVVGHVEWVEFLPVDRVPAPGAVLRAPRSWAEPAGGGGVAAAELARLAGRCTLVTAAGDDVVGRGLPRAFERLNVDVVATTRSEPHRRAVTWVDPTGERTITVVGPAQHAVGSELDAGLFDGVDVVYFCKGDAAALVAARRARVVVATARVLPVLRGAGVRLDALVRSANDPAEVFDPGDLAPAPGLVASTDGGRGGRWRGSAGAGVWDAAAPPSEVFDAYGAGDCFAAALGFALAEGRSIQAAVDFAATRGAAALGRRGAHGQEWGLG